MRRQSLLSKPLESNVTTSFPATTTVSGCLCSSDMKRSSSLQQMPLQAALHFIFQGLQKDESADILPPQEADDSRTERQLRTREA